MRSYKVHVTKTTEESIKEHMFKMSELYDAHNQPFFDEQTRILEILRYRNPYTEHNWRYGPPERRFKNGFDITKLSLDTVDKEHEEQRWHINVEYDFNKCMNHFKWNEEWATDFQYKIEQTRQQRTDNGNEIRTLDETTFYLAKTRWMEEDAVWIAREKLKVSHRDHHPREYYIELFKKDKEIEKGYASRGGIPDNEDTCEFCIHDKIVREANAEKTRKADEEYERLREEADEEHRRQEEERKAKQKPIQLKEHKCETCNYKTMDGAMYRIHLMSREHLQLEKQKNLFCEHCDHQCRGRLEFEAHIRTSKHKKNAGELDGPTTYTCEACEYSTHFKHHYENHIRSKRHTDKTTQEVVVPTTD